MPMGQRKTRRMVLVGTYCVIAHVAMGVLVPQLVSVAVASGSVSETLPASTTDSLANGASASPVVLCQCNPASTASQVWDWPGSDGVHHSSPLRLKSDPTRCAFTGEELGLPGPPQHLYLAECNGTSGRSAPRLGE